MLHIFHQQKILIHLSAQPHIDEEYTKRDTYIDMRMNRST
uniref:Uncharacterized protein n=1 Tax=Rhizophora mucronata TaxID=61149 RepID=A0A2P2P964_RHIMU